jgi:hypothetical protein
MMLTPSSHSTQSICSTAAGAGRLEELARGVHDRVDSPSCRDRGADEQRLLGSAAVADQRARLLDAAGRRRG